MKVKEMVRDNKVKWAIACVIIGLVFAVGITLVSCSGIASVGGIGANQAVADAADGVVEPKQSLLGKRRMTRRGQRRPRAYPATKQQPRVKLRLPRVLPRMHNIKGLRANQKETQQFRPRAPHRRNGWRTQSAYGKPGLKAFPFIARWRSPSATSAEPTLPATPPPMRKST
jgi:hypothetical protein